MHKISLNIDYKYPRDFLVLKAWENSSTRSSTSEPYTITVLHEKTHRNQVFQVSRWYQPIPDIFRWHSRETSFLYKCFEEGPQGMMLCLRWIWVLACFHIHDRQAHIQYYHRPVHLHRSKHKFLWENAIGMLISRIRIAIVLSLPLYISLLDGRMKMLSIHLIYKDKNGFDTLVDI